MDTETRKKAVQKLLVSVPDYIQKVQCDTYQWSEPFKCAVISCQNIFLSFEERDKYPYKFHNFPLSEHLRKIWKRQCGLPDDEDISKLKVCSDHFSLDDYIRNYREEFLNPNFKRKLKADAIPQKNVTVNENSNTNSESSSEENLLNFDEVKIVIDENEMLKKKYEALLKEKCDVMDKITLYRKRNDYKMKKLKKLQDILRKERPKAKKNLKNKNIVRQVFSDAQINILLGNKKVFWSDDDLARAFSLRHIGSKECYLYLKNELNMPLPALSCVQKWAASCDTS